MRFGCYAIGRAYLALVELYSNVGNLGQAFDYFEKLSRKSSSVNYNNFPKWQNSELMKSRNSKVR